MTIKIITDSTADLPKEIIERFGIEVVPLSVRFGNETYSSQELSNADFYRMMKEHSELPKTSSPSPYDFYEKMTKYSKDTSLLVITLSNKLSSTFDSAMVAKRMIHDENPEREIAVIDSKTSSLGLGLIVYKAAGLIKAGTTFSDLVTFVQKGVVENKTLFFLETLENVIKGGRLDKFRGTIASVLNIKLLMQASAEGTIEVLEKVRGTQNAIKRLIDMIGEFGHEFENKVLAISHSNCEEKAKQILKQILERYPFAEVIFSEMGPTIGTYAGEGGVVISY